jgi:hypothetical protein
VSSGLKSDPAWDEKVSGIGRREKRVSARKDKNINIAALVLLNFSQLNRTTKTLGTARDLLPSPFEKYNHWCALNISAANFRRYKSYLVSITSKASYSPNTRNTLLENPMFFCGGGKAAV